MVKDKILKPIDILEREWLKRIEIVESGRTPEKTYQRSNLFYDFLYNCEKKGVKPAKFSTFKYNLIYKLEDKHGYMKEDLNIYSKSDAVLYRRYGTEFIVYDHTVYRCLGILTTEKSGIAEPLTGELSKRGIFVVDTQGIQSRYAMQIVKRYLGNGHPAFTTSDYDISGCFMMKRYTDIGATRVSLLDVMNELGLDWDDVVQVDDSPKNNHFASIDAEDQDTLRPGDGTTYRIEMDTIMSRVKAKDFSEAFLRLIDQHVPLKDVGNVMIVPGYPSDIGDLVERLEDHFNNYYYQMRERLIQKYNRMDIKFVDLNLPSQESRFNDRFNDMANDDHIDTLQNLLDDVEDSDEDDDDDDDEE